MKEATICDFCLKDSKPHEEHGMFFRNSSKQNMICEYCVLELQNKIYRKLRELRDAIKST